MCNHNELGKKRKRSLWELSNMPHQMHHLNQCRHCCKLNRPGVSSLHYKLKCLSVECASWNDLYTHDPLSLQVEEIVHNGTTVLHGPDTPARFDEFSLAVVTDELRTSAPDLFSLMNCLADSQRNAASSSEVTGKQRKVVMSLCTLLNARSQ